MEVSRIDEPCDRWDSFVWASPGGTIFSTLKFLSYHPRSRFNHLNLAIEEGGQLVAVIAGGDMPRDGRRYFRSPVGASFGGLVCGSGCDLGSTCRAVEAFTATVKEEGYAGAELVCSPGCYSSSADQGLRFALIKSGYGIVSMDATLVVDLDLLDKDDLDPVLARNIRKAERGGATVRAATSLGGFYDVLTANLEAKGAKPTHSLKELEHLQELFPDRFIVLEAIVEGKIAAGCLAIICNSRVGLAFYICDDRRYSQLRVAEATVFGTAGLLKRMGLKYFDLGTVSLGSEVNWGLTRFKAKFRPATYVREHYLLEFEGG
jgi:Acetyltransferase (GNAT) domain